MDQPHRVVGKRSPPPADQVPSEGARAAMTRMAGYLTRAPKGVFHYRSHEEANRDREQWLIEAMVAEGEDRRVIEEALLALKKP